MSSAVFTAQLRHGTENSAAARSRQETVSSNTHKTLYSQAYKRDLQNATKRKLDNLFILDSNSDTTGFDSQVSYSLIL